MSEKFCLKWNDFETNVSKSFGLLRNEDYLHDVTLVCDDNSQVSAHKLVLSASSDFFKTMFKNNKHQNPLICLEGVSSKELTDIIDYMYHGEANIFQEGLDRFLSIAQRLKIMGLLQNGENDPDSDDPEYQTNQVDMHKPPLGKYEAENESFEFNEKSNIPDNPIKNKWPIKRNFNRTVSLNVDDTNNINQRADELIETLPDGSLKCLQCGKVASQGSLKQSYKQNMRNHAETHLDGLSLDCQICGKIFRSRNSLNSHRSQNHR